MDDEDREAVIERAHEALRRSDATLKWSGYTGRKPYAHADAYLREREQKLSAKESEPMASQFPQYVTKADARESQDRVEQAIGIIVARQRDALEQRSAALFDLLAELDARWSAIEARISRIEAAMSIAPTISDDATH